MLFGLLDTEKNCHKRKTDATVANNTGKVTDAKKAFILGEIARIEALADLMLVLRAILVKQLILR